MIIGRNLNDEEPVKWKSGKRVFEAEETSHGLQGSIQRAMLAMYEFTRSRAFVHSFTHHSSPAVPGS